MLEEADDEDEEDDADADAVDVDVDLLFSGVVVEEYRICGSIWRGAAHVAQT